MFLVIRLLNILTELPKSAKQERSQTFRASCGCLSILPVRAESLTPREKRDTHKEQWGTVRKSINVMRKKKKKKRCFLIFHFETSEKTKSRLYLHF